jgi:ribonuclease-3 family protein
MEKSITAGLEEYIRTIPGMKEIDAKQCSPLVLAYVGDCVYDLIIKTMVVGRGNRPVHRLHEKPVCAGISTVLYDAFHAGASE